MQHNLKKVIIVGAGPVGLLIAYMLGKEGISVDVVEAWSKLNDSPRGLAYAPPATKVLKNTGLFEKIAERGYIPKDLAWRKHDGEYIVGLSGIGDLSIIEYPYVCYPVGSLTALLYEEVQKLPSVSVHFNHKVLEVGQDDDKAWIVTDDVEKNGKRMEGDIVIGCDGGQSTVRRSLFGKEFPGFTWPMQLIANNIYYDFNKYGWSDIQWVIHPERWMLVSKVNNDGLWRIAYPEEMGISEEEIATRRIKKFKEDLPGNPSPADYELAMSSPYKIHQRLVERMRVGRVVLAGDAAHLNNPMGGLGLTCGICDVGSLVDCLMGVDRGKASLDILEMYDHHRRRVFNDIINPVTTKNLERLRQDPSNVKENDPFLRSIAAAQTDPQLAEELMNEQMAMYVDMTSFYNKK